MKKSFNIQELLHRKSKHHETKLMHPSSSRAFQRDQELDLKHPGLVDLISTKQNKLPSFINRYAILFFKLFFISIFYSTFKMSINEGSSYIHETHFYQAWLVKKHIFINGDGSSHPFYFPTNIRYINFKCMYNAIWIENLYGNWQHYTYLITLLLDKWEFFNGVTLHTIKWW